METVRASVIIPSYNELESLVILLSEIDEVVCQAKAKAVESWDLEVIVVDDGSSDGTKDWLRAQCVDRNYSFRLKGLISRRNYGKSSALRLGLSQSSGKTVVLMDADLQDNPNDLWRLIEKSESTGGLVVGWKKKRLDPWSKRFPSKIFNWLVSRMSGVHLHDHNCGFKAGPGELMRALPMYGELHRFIPSLASFAGFQITEEVVEHRARSFGESKFGFERFIRGLADLITVTFLNRYSDRPNHVFTAFGGLSLCGGVGLLMYLATLKIFASQPIDGRPLFDIGIMLVLVSLMLLCFGLVLEMVVRNSSNRSWREGLTVGDEFSSDEFSGVELTATTDEGGADGQR